jgi:hypothetical protein
LLPIRNAPHWQRQHKCKVKAQKNDKKLVLKVSKSIKAKLKTKLVKRTKRSVHIDKETIKRLQQL